MVNLKPFRCFWGMLVTVTGVEVYGIFRSPWKLWELSYFWIGLNHQKVGFKWQQMGFEATFRYGIQPITLVWKSLMNKNVKTINLGSARHLEGADVSDLNKRLSPMWKRVFLSQYPKTHGLRVKIP
jgi:hypothetical protein